MYNLYIDESCHLENDRKKVMCIGYTKVLAEAYPKVKEYIKQLKLAHKNPTEIKWNTVSLSRLPLYKALVDYFFISEIEFRCVLVKYKDRLDHQRLNGDSKDTFYYNMVYFLLQSAANSSATEYKVLLDIKDTRGKEKLNKITEILTKEYAESNKKSPFTHFQHIHSHENVLLQLTDLFIGAITFKSQGHHLKENANKAKVEIVNYLESKSGYFIDEGTEPWETKFNILDHQPKGKQAG